VNGFATSLPTHIGLYDLGKRTLVTEISVEDAGLNAIFSIVPTTVL
jgi:hypothetical protein